MPVYEFKHARTGEVIERFYSMSEAPQSVREGGRVFKRIWSAPGLIVNPDISNGRPIDFVSNALDIETYGKHHIGAVVKDKYGVKQLHFGSRREIEHLKRSYNASDEAQRTGKYLRYGECDEWRDALRAEGDRDLKPAGGRPVPGGVGGSGSNARVGGNGKRKAGRAKARAR